MEVPRAKGFGCFTWLGLMLAAFLLGGTYFGLTQQREDWTYLSYLALPLALVATIINIATDKRDKERKAAEAQAEAAERAQEHENRIWLWQQKVQEAERYARARNGEQFSVALRPQGSSPFDVAPVSTRATTQDILEAIRESRERG